MKTTLGMISIGLIIVYIFAAIFVLRQEYLLGLAAPIDWCDFILYQARFSATCHFLRQGGTGEIVSRFTDANRILMPWPVQSCRFSWMCQLCWSLRLFFSQNSSLFFSTLLGIPALRSHYFSLWSLLKRWISETIASQSVVVFHHWRYQWNWNHQVFDQWKAALSKDWIRNLWLIWKKVFCIWAFWEFAALKAASLILNVLTLWLGATLVMDQKSVWDTITYNTL